MTEFELGYREHDWIMRASVGLLASVVGRPYLGSHTKRPRCLYIEYKQH